MVSITDALIHCLPIAFSDCFAASLWGHQWSPKQVEICSNTAVIEVLRSGTSWDSNLLVLLRHPLPVGSLELLCVYCLSRCKKIKCHSWRHFLFSISVVLSASSLCVSHNNASTSFGLGPAACNLDQKCQFYLINGLASVSSSIFVL